MNLLLDGEGALYQQLARALKVAILDGKLMAGSPLPATRTLSEALHVSRNTVLGAYEILCAEQLAVTREGSGTRVAAPLAARADSERTSVRPQSRYAARARQLGLTRLVNRQQEPRYNLQYGEPLLNPALFDSWRRRLAAAAQRAGPGYPPPGGYLPLRQAICDYLARRRGVACAANDVIIVAGTQQALTIVSRVVLDENDVAVMEDPNHELAINTLVAHGARVVSVRTDSQGIVTAEIPTRETRLIVVTPSHQFPSGAVLSLARRIELLTLAERQNAWIFEDDYDAEFAYPQKRLPALRALDVADRVIYAGSFSKTVFPSLRLGYIVCPQGIRDDLLAAKSLDDMGCPTIEQAALATFMQSRQFDKHLRKSATELRSRRRALIDGLKKHTADHLEVVDSQGGMHFAAWFRRLDYAQLDALILLAASRGLGLHSLTPFFQQRPPRPGLLMGFASLSLTQIRAATELLGRCIHDLTLQGLGNPR